MEKTYFKYIRRIFYYIHALAFICSSFPIYSQNLNIKSKDDTTEEDVKTLLEYDTMLKEFEKIAEEEFDIEVRGGVLKKWGKKLKKWFVKTATKTLTKMVRFKKLKSGEHCAYEVARFKRKIDEKLHKTGDIEDMLSNFSLETNDFAKGDMEKFKERVLYYYHHKDEKPPKNTKVKSDLDDVPVRVVIGSVEVACGVLIAVLPFPGCWWLGRAIVGHGITQIFEGYAKKIEDDYDRNKNNRLLSV